MKFRRQRFQRGTLRKVARADNQWAWEYRYQDPLTGKRKSMFISTEKFPTQVAVERHLEAFVLKLNSDNPALAILEPTFDAVLDRFIEDERLLEIKQLRPGDRNAAEGELSYATATSYLSVIKQVRVKWGNYPPHAHQAGPGSGMAEEDGRRTQDQRPRQGTHASVV